MFCSQCGVTLKDGAKFCSSCGSNESHGEPVPKVPITSTLVTGQRMPCENCGLTNYNFVRTCFVVSGPRVSGCGKFGCDLCFTTWAGEKYICPECKPRIESLRIIAVIIGVIAFFAIMAITENPLFF